MACNSNVNVTVENINCQAEITPDQILEGEYGPGFDCIGPFEVVVLGLNNQPLPNSPFVGPDEVGLTLTVKVTDTNSGQTCWGSIKVEDKNIPDLSCSPKQGRCDDDISPEALGFPVPSTAMVFQTPAQQGSNSYTVSNFDPCGDVVLSFTDSEQNNRCADFNRVITRTWVVTDPSGNSSTCSETISLRRLTVSDVVRPLNRDGIEAPALNCEDRCPDGPRPSCGNAPLGWNVIPPGEPFAGNPSPFDDFYECNGAIRCEGTGFPSGIDCGDIRITFEDTRLNICTTGQSEGCYKIIRRWSLIDWCTGQLNNFDQVIKVEDTEGPTIADVEDVTITTDVWRCAADWNVQPIWLSDNCSSAPLTYTVTSSGGDVRFQFGNYVIKDLAPGTYDVTYTAEDCCGNESQKTIKLTVQDDTPPVAVCDQNTVTTLTTTTGPDGDNLGTSKVFARTFDDGSFDSCSDRIWFKALRMDEYDSNGNGKPGESVISGDHEAIDCNGANGDDDVRPFPPTIVPSALGVGLISNPAYRNKDQAYFDDFVKFCCEDVGESIMVVFRVYDVDPTPYEFRNVFPASDPRFSAWYNVNPHKDPADYTGVIAEAESNVNWPIPNAGIGPLYGHFNDCMVEVTVQEKLAPYVVAPPDIVVTCDFWFEFDPDNPNDFTEELDAVFGKVAPGAAGVPAQRDSIIIRDRVCPLHPRFAEFAPSSPFDDPCYDDQYDIFWGIDGYAIDNCHVDIEQTIIPDLTCGTGIITRQWRAADAQGNWSNIAQQRIRIINCREFYVPTVCWRFTPRDIGSCDFVGGSFAEKLIEWPCDIVLNRCQGPVDEVFLPDNLDILFDEDRRPRFADDNCSMIASSFDDRIFTFVDSSCVKIFRTWELIDWCRFEEGLTPFRWEWEQVIKLLNEDGPEFENCSQTACGFGNPDDVNAPQCVGEVTIDPGISDDCTKIEDLRIDYKFDFFNDGSFDAFGYSDNYGPVYPFPNPNNLPVRRFAAEDYAITGFFPVGTHRILWAAEDGCGNANICEYILQIDDCKPPTPYCLPGVSTIPMPINAGGFVDIFASDLDLDSGDNCTSSENLRFAFSEDPNDTFIRRTCADVTGLVEEVVIYVFDEADNFATCRVGVLLNDCGAQTTATISGDVENTKGENVENVMIHLGGHMTQEEMTGISGFFEFTNLPVENNYVIRPERNDNPLNGVSTYDLVLISKHVLSIEELDSPYKIIAADANNSGSVTAFDLVEIRKTILYITTEFPNNTSWRFIPADFVFQSNNPFDQAFPEVYDVNNLIYNTNADFVAIKTADVNESARPNEAIGSEDRNAAGELQFELEEQTLEAGELYTVNFKANGLSEIEAYQFTLDFDETSIEIVEVLPQLTNMDQSNFGMNRLSEGVLTTSWNAPFNGARLSNTNEAFQLTLRAKRNLKLSEALTINSTYTAAEAYQLNEQKEVQHLDVSLKVLGTQSGVASLELHQNIPNPFKNETMIGFVLPEAGDASLSIFDVNGKLLQRIERTFDAGYNQVNINASSLNVNGLLYYSLETAEATLTRKMILTAR
ncbi:MAG: T9SS type A sorting domain-containing protein [Bacteroidota bacterium]